jgi:hypothetical protein
VGVTGDVTEASYQAGPLCATTPTTRAAARARSAGVFVDVTRILSDEVTFRGGIRADGLSGERGGLRFAPRASVTWGVGPQAFLTVAAGRYHQHARAPRVDVEQAIEDVVDGEASSADLLPVATADHVVLSLDQELGEATRLGLEGFWKGYEGLDPGRHERIRSSGVDLRVQRRGQDFTAWVGYGLSWFWSATDLSGTSNDFAGRHLLSAGAQGRLAGPLSGELRVAYGAGLPYTSIPFGSADVANEGTGPTAPGELANADTPLAGGVDDAFLRVDVEIDALLTPRWGGREWTIRPYVRILNALDRRDALFYAFSRSEGLTPLADRPLIPVLGVSWRF